MNAVEVKDVSKRFRIQHEKNVNLKYAFIDFLKGKRPSYEEFWALRGISFGVRQGETLGIIGENGSGKSTLLKLIARILRADEGTIRTEGKVAALLELGAGFNPELTGRENIYLKSSILGFGRKEADERLAGIVEFAELEKFIDSPVKSYSSGMYMRLGFSVAIHIDPDILLIDEILAVGDEAFQKKCYERIRDFQRLGKSIVVVSHNLNAIAALCSRAVLLQSGRILSSGPPDEVIAQYRKPERRAAEKSKDVDEYGTREIEIRNVAFLDERGNEAVAFRSGCPMTIRIEYFAKSAVTRPVFGVSIGERDGSVVYGTNSCIEGQHIECVEGVGFADFTITHIPILHGRYPITIAIHSEDGKTDYHWQRDLYSITVYNDQGYEGSFRLPCTFSMHMRSAEFMDGTDDLRLEEEIVHGEAYPVYGWYDSERAHDHVKFRHIKRSAKLLYKVKGSASRLTALVRASHPDVESSPVRGEVLLDGKVVGEFILKDNNRTALAFELPCPVDGPVEIDIHVDRVWVPDRIHHSGDTREIALSVSEIFLE